MRCIAILATVFLVFQEDPAEKPLANMLKLMDAGRYAEGRAYADQIHKKWPKSAVAQKAKPYAQENAFLRIVPLEINGPAGNRVDVVLMADGVEYDDKRQAQWDKDADALIKSVFTVEPLKEYAKFFNTYRANVGSKEAKLNKVDGPIQTFFRAREDDTGDILADGFAARDVAKQSGADDSIALLQVRAGPPGHAFSGHGVSIFGSPKPSLNAMLHAWGHGVGGLGDESASARGGSWGFGGSSDKREKTPIPTSANVCDSSAPDKVPWTHWVEAKKAGDRRATRVDVMEGAVWRSKGAWRPYQDGDCIMSGGAEFCPVCKEQLVLVMYTYIRPIDGGTPFEKPVKVAAGKSADLSVFVLQPASHKMSVEWILERLKPADKSTGGEDAKGRKDDDTLVSQALRCGDGMTGPRKGEGPKWKAPEGEALGGNQKKDGDRSKETVTFDASRLGPGKYRVTVVVRDTTDLVLRDTENLLSDYRSWLVEVQ